MNFLEVIQAVNLFCLYLIIVQFVTWIGVCIAPSLPGDFGDWIKECYEEGTSGAVFTTLFTLSFASFLYTLPIQIVAFFMK